MRLFELAEAPYKGNVGIHEMMKFYSLASDEQKKQLEHLIATHKNQEAWDLIKQVTNLDVNRADVMEAHELGTYVSIYVSDESVEQLETWCNENNVKINNDIGLHCTIIYSKTPVPELQKLDKKPVSVTGKPKGWEILGEDNLVLLLENPGAELLFKKMSALGATSDYDSYKPHVTIDAEYKTEDLPQSVPDFDIQFDRYHVEELDEDK